MQSALCGARMGGGRSGRNMSSSDSISELPFVSTIASLHRALTKIVRPSVYRTKGPRGRPDLRGLKIILGFVGLSAALHSSPTFAQELEGSWNDVKQVHEGDRIVVVDMGLKSVRGTFAGATDDAVSMYTGDQLLQIQRGDIFRVSRLIPSKRKRNILLGSALGAGVGAAGGAALAYGLFPDEGGSGKANSCGDRNGSVWNRVGGAAWCEFRF